MDAPERIWATFGSADAGLGFWDDADPGEATEYVRKDLYDDLNAVTKIAFSVLPDDARTDLYDALKDKQIADAIRKKGK